MRALAGIASTLLTVLGMGAGAGIGLGYFVGIAIIGFVSLWIVFAYGRGK